MDTASVFTISFIASELYDSGCLVKKYSKPATPSAQKNCEMMIMITAGCRKMVPFSAMIARQLVSCSGSYAITGGSWLIGSCGIFGVPSSAVVSEANEEANAKAFCDEEN